MVQKWVWFSTVEQAAFQVVGLSLLTISSKYIIVFSWLILISIPRSRAYKPDYAQTEHVLYSIQQVLQFNINSA